MAVTITSTTDNPESITKALEDRHAAEPEQEEQEEAEAEAADEGEGEAEDDEAAADDEESDDEESEDEDEAEAEAKDDEAPKPKKKARVHADPDAEDRISQLTFDRNRFRGALLERDEENARLREQVARLSRGESADGDPKPAVKEFTEPEPELENFDTLEQWMVEHNKWTRASIKFEMEQELETRLAKTTTENRQQDEQTQLMTAHAARLDAYRKANPEFVTLARTAQENQVPVTPLMTEHIVRSEFGPHILHYLAENPDDAVAISKMSAGAALVRLGKIEAKIEAKVESKTGKTATTDTAKAGVPPQPPKPKTKVEPPITPLGSAATKTTKKPDDMNFQEYKTFRNQQKSGRR